MIQTITVLTQKNWRESYFFQWSPNVVNITPGDYKEVTSEEANIDEVTTEEANIEEADIEELNNEEVDSEGEDVTCDWLGAGSAALGEELSEALGTIWKIISGGESLTYY